MDSGMSLRDWLATIAMPDRHDGESDGDYTDRIHRQGAARGVNRQCSIGYHEQCSDPDGESCRCVCHMAEAPDYQQLVSWLKTEMDDGDRLRDMAGVDADWSSALNGERTDA